MSVSDIKHQPALEEKVRMKSKKKSHDRRLRYFHFQGSSFELKNKGINY